MDQKKIENATLNELEHTGISAALAAATILRTGFYSELKIKQKSHLHDVVTQFDVQAEEAILRVLRSTYKNHAFLGEESGLVGNKTDEYLWIIDPIDGTWNFARQIPSFCISIAVLHNMKTILSISFDPMSNELFIGKKGHGAFMNGKRIFVRPTKTLEESGISLGGAVGKDSLHHVSQIRRSGSSVLDISYVAKGALEGFIEWNLNIWDFVGPALLVEEAGGMVTSPTGKTIEIELGKKFSVVASNGFIHKDLIKWTSTVEK